MEKMNAVLYIHGKGGSVAEIGDMIEKACFISPVVDMERLNGYELTGEWLRYVRSHPIRWNVPTHILYGSRDQLTSLKTVRAFAEKHKATLSIMEGRTLVPHRRADAVSGQLDT